MGFATGDEERGSNETLFNCTGRTEIWYGPCAAVCRWIGMSLSKQSGSLTSIIDEEMSYCVGPRSDGSPTRSILPIARL
jgi:hypothetical protein